MMVAARMASLFAIMLTSLFGSWAIAESNGFVLTEDIGVTFSAAPTQHLSVGEPIEFELSVVNYGDDPVSYLSLASSHFVHEIVPGPSDCTLITQVGDGEDFYVYNLAWFVSGAAGGAPLESGEARTCRFQMALTSAAPAEFLFTFGLPTYYSDPNPANDRVTLILRRGDFAPTTLPVGSLIGWLLLALGMAVVAAMRLHPARVMCPTPKRRW